MPALARRPGARSPIRPLLAAVAAVSLLAGTALPVAAAEPPVLTGQLTDIAERLVGDEEGIQRVLGDLRDLRDITLSVITLDAIDGEDPGAFADAIAATNDLGPRDAVLFVSFGDRQFGMWTGRDLQVGPERIDELLVVLGDDLRAGLTREGIARAARNLEHLVDGEPLEASGSGQEPTDPEPMETAPSESFPSEPEPSFDEGPIGFGPEPPGGQGIGGAMLAVVVIGAAVVGFGMLRGGRTGIAGSARPVSRWDDQSFGASSSSGSGSSSSSDSGSSSSSGSSGSTGPSSSSSSGSGHGSGSSSGGSW